MRRAATSILGVCLTLTLVARSSAAGITEEQAQASPMQADARLADLCFVDARHGWAVGDRGVIWHTADGGAQWKLQASGADCSLSSVFFLDEKTGWAAGGFTQPYTHTSSGVMLRTRDGGEHWQLEKKVILPTIARIGFFDTQRGWALGQPSALFPSGAFATQDGGRSWSALPSSANRGWLTGEFIDPHNGALAGRTGGLAAIRQRGVEPLPGEFGLRAMRRMMLVPPARGWLVGDGGLVLQTRDLGKSWQTPEGDLPEGTRDHFDFSALAVRGPHCWLAGAPGTRVFHSDDNGSTWSAVDTGQTVPIHALAFVDERTGWAAGALGTILATRDGGVTWQKQQAGGARAALVGFYGSPSEIPFELLAQLSADQGYLSTIEILSRDDVDVRSAGSADPALQAHQASVRAGASAAESAWRFPLRQPGIRLSAEQLIEAWNQANDTEALEKLEAYVVSRLRTWRPSVVFTTAADSQRGDPLAHLVNQVVLRSVEAAADPARYSAQISQAGLQAWQVQKVYAALPPGENGTVNVDTGALAARLGRSIGELAAPARAVIAPRFVAPDASLGFRLLVDRIPQDAGRRDFFSGIALSPGGEARRRFDEVADSDLETLHRQVQRRRNLQAILAQAESNDPRDGRFLADVAEQTRSMDPERAVDVIWQLAERYLSRGRWELAAECFDLVVQRHPDHPLAGVALTWLVQYHASGEAECRLRATQPIDARAVSVQPAAPGPLDARGVEADRRPVRRASADSETSRVEPASRVVDILQTAPGGRFAKADAYAKQLEMLRPALLSEPTVRFPLAVAHREQGLPRQAERYFLGLRHGRPHDAWWACAQAELWLADPQNQPPKPQWKCPTTPDKPRLDGQLDEPLWRGGNVVELKSPLRDDADWPAVAMLARDDEFLYIGISCTKSDKFQYAKSDEPRPRDADLGDRDRVELLIDVDRDFVTYYRLAIDHRGWTGESCWGDKSWDPTWFVASGGDEQTWTAEAAIPLAELSDEAPTKGRVWAVGIQRVVPGVGLQAWTTPAATEVIAEGFGYLMFQAE